VQSFSKSLRRGDLNKTLTFKLVFLLCVLGLALTASSRSQAKKLIKDSAMGESFRVNHESDNENARNEESTTRTYFKEGENGADLRKLRRVGLGLQAAGALGLGGAILDLNFTPQWTFSGGFGGGEGFQALELQGKYVLAGDWLMPYMSFGYARWSSINKSTYIQKTSPAILGEKLLSDSERTAGEYQKNLFYPGVGLQFSQLKGEWAGTSVYAEFLVLVDIGEFVAAPTGALGVLYYF